MTYRPRDFWDRRLSEHFDLRGTGETDLSLEYNRACYALRRYALDRALRRAGMDPAGREVLDVGCGTGFFTAYYLERGAHVTGIDIAPVSIAKLQARHPGARFVLADIGEAPVDGCFDVVNVFDVLYHITDDARWAQAVRHLARAVAAGGVLLITDTFTERRNDASHNLMRPYARYTAVLEAEGLHVESIHATHVLLNRDLGPARFLNRAPWLLYGVDRTWLGLGIGPDPRANKLMVARRRA